MTNRLIRCTFTPLILAAIISLSSCGGGSTSAGIGGSGIGGTGITVVRGNVATVSRAGIGSINFRNLDIVSNESEFVLLNSAHADDSVELIAQTRYAAGIIISGGGKSTVTDSAGRFALVNVTPGNNFALILVLQSNQKIGLNIGNVPAGSDVVVKDIVINTSQGTAKPSNIEVNDNDDEDSTDSEDNKEDEDSTDPEDPDSIDPEDPEDPEDPDSTDD